MYKIIKVIKKGNNRDNGEKILKKIKESKKQIKESLALMEQLEKSILRNY